MMPHRWTFPWSIVVLVAVVVTTLDQITKRVASNSLGPGSDRDPIGIIPSFLQLRYVENTGAAFGILQDSTVFLVFVSFGVIALLALIFGGMISRSPLLGVAFGLQFGGALGNLIDRIRLGYVVDFIDVSSFPTFNVADSGITVGVVILAFVLLIKPEWAADPDASHSADQEATAGTAQPVEVPTDYEKTPSPTRDGEK